MSNFHGVVYPFTAIVGQEKMKKGLILNAINPKIGGVLIRGEKGTAKSTAVRALAVLLPEINVVQGCSFNCNPEDKNHLCNKCTKVLNSGQKLQTVLRKVQVIELPVSATEDRVAGTLDFQYAVKYGKCKFEPGILAEAHRGIVYVDEVNLLDDHIVDILLDTAAMGINVVEREGVSYSHLSEFVLVGTMNPEEGELRPQLLDRFGLCVEVQGTNELYERVEIIKRRDAFDNDPIDFIEKWQWQEQKLKCEISKAREILHEVTISDENIKLITKLSIEAFVSGHRADIVMDTTARTIAAWHGRKNVIEEDVYEAAELALLHRASQASPPPQEPEPPEKEEESNDEEKKNEEKKSEEEKNEEQPQNEKEQSKNEKKNSDMEEQQKDEINEEDQDKDEMNVPPSSGEKEFVFSVGQPFQVKPITYDKDRILRKGSGRRSNTKTASKAGRYIRSTMNRKNNDLALDATLRAAAPYQIYRCRDDVAVAIESSDIRCKLREKRIGNFLLFVVDASGSMGADRRMEESKGAVLSLLLDAYQKRDKIGMIAFKGDSAEVILPPTNSVELAHKLLEEMPTGGKTPLSSALNKAYEVSKAQLFKDENTSPMLIIISDGKGNVSMGSDKPLVEAAKVAETIQEEERIKTLVIDVEKKSFVSFGLAKELALKLGAKYYKVDELKANTLVQAVKDNI